MSLKTHSPLSNARLRGATSAPSAIPQGKRVRARMTTEIAARLPDQACATAKFHVGSDHAVWPDFHVIGEHRAGIDARCVSNQSGHDHKAPLEREM